MATILLPFNTDPQLTGAMVGDSVYYIDSTDLTGASGESGGTNSNANNVIHMGTISGFSGSWNILVDTAVPYLDAAAEDLGFTMPTSSDYIFFTKNNNHNIASVLGYYAQVQFENDSTTAAELFSVGMEVAESSK